MIPVQVSNGGSSAVLIEAVTLHAQPEWECAAAAVAVTHSTPGFRIEPGAVTDREIPFAASPLCHAATNYLDILVTYRDLGAETTDALLLTRLRACYVIIEEPPLRRQQIFISYKEPEDLQLAEWLEKIVRRHGFRPYRARIDVQPGTNIWKRKIVPQIRASKALAILCTRLTPLGPGVEREIKLAARARKMLIPFVERDAPLLEILRTKRDIERVTFERADAPLAFAQAIAAMRQKR